MPSHLPELVDFLMITDTAMVRKNGKMYAFGPVVRELEVFQKLFRSVEWIGFECTELSEDSIMMPVPADVHCVLLRASGGNSWIKKAGVLIQAPLMLWAILKSMRGKKVIHTRAPSVPAFIAALLSIFFQKKIWWHKYAGNWGESHPPFFYGLQRSWLTRAHWSKVTINGHWTGQPAHCLSFENPCLNEENRRQGAKALAQKDYTGPLQICFVGHLSEAKGIDKLLEALPNLPAKRITAVHLVGDGPLREQCEAAAAQLPFPLSIHGYLNHARVGEIMAASHLLVLPSRSEGFPKVVSEGGNYGCVPVVSDVSAIGQYVIDGKNGFLLAPEKLAAGLLAADLHKVLSLPDFKPIAEAAYAMAGEFTFERYRERIIKELLTETSKKIINKVPEYSGENIL